MGMRETVRETMQRYTRSRLRKECNVHGVAAEIARATGFAKPTISAILSSDKGPGDRLMRALGEHWGMNYQQLEDTAIEWSKKHPSPTTPARQPHIYRPLSSLPGWDDALAAAKARHRSIPAEVWDKVAFVYVPDFGEATAERVGRIAQVIFDTEPGTPASVDAPPASVALPNAAPPATQARRGRR